MDKTLILIFLIFVTSQCWAQTSIYIPMEPKNTCFHHNCSNTIVKISGQITSISGIDFQESSVKISGFLSINWDWCTNIRPDRTLLIVNAVDRTGTLTTIPTYSDAMCTNQTGTQKWRFEGRFRQRYSFERYPLEKHRIKISFVENFYSNGEVTYVLDDIGLSDIDIVGWKIDGQDFIVENNSFTIVTFLDRNSAIYILRVLPPIIIAMLFTMSAFLFEVKDINTRVTGSTGGLVTLMFLNMNLFSVIPKGGAEYILLDTIFLVSYIITLCVIVETFVIYRYSVRLNQEDERELMLKENKEDEKVERRIGRIRGNKVTIKKRIKKMDKIFFIICLITHLVFIISISIGYGVS